jgi:putative redox protein
MAKPPVVADLVWTEALRFDATSARITTCRGWRQQRRALAGADAGLRTGRLHVRRCRGHRAQGPTPLTGFSAHLVAERAQEHPTRVVRAELHFHVRGDVPAAAIERAITLSRDKYCSVWHSMRQDIELTTSFDVTT